MPESDTWEIRVGKVFTTQSTSLTPEQAKEMMQARSSTQEQTQKMPSLPSSGIPMQVAKRIAEVV
jgi:hypothetical protein